MIDLLPVLMKGTPTLRGQLKQWFSSYPSGNVWRVASDYAIGDPNKLNDVISFVMIAPHATDADVQQYVGGVAPKDLKKVSVVPLGLMQYLNCPVPITFSMSFVLPRDAAMLRDRLPLDGMVLLAQAAITFLEQRLSLYSEPADIEYHRSAIKRFQLFERDLARKSVSEKLARQIHVVAATAATVFNSLNDAVRPQAIRWISDRDKLVAAHDTVVYDLAYVYRIVQVMQAATPEQQAAGNLGASMAPLGCEIPEPTGDHRFDDFVRLPDYLAGTLADINLETMTFTRDKFGEVLNSVLANSPNNWMVQLLRRTDGGVTVRSAQFKGWD